MTELRFELLHQLRSQWLLLSLLGPLATGVAVAVGTAPSLPTPAPATAPAVRVAAPDAVADRFGDGFDVVATAPDGFEAVPDGADVAVAAEGDGYVVRGQKGGSDARAALQRALRDDWAAAWTGAGQDPEALVVYEVEARSPLHVDRAGSLPTALALLASVGAYSSAMGAFTQSRQDRTRHTVNLLPQSNTRMLWAKLGAVVIATSLNGLLTLLGFVAAIAVSTGVIPWGALAAAAPTVALCAQVAAAWSAIAAASPDTRTLSFAGGFALLVLGPLGAVTYLPALPPAIAAAPIVGPAVAIREVVSGGSFALSAASIAATAGWLAVGLAITQVAWAREPGEVRPSGLRHAAALWVLVMLLFTLVAAPAQMIHASFGLALGQWGILVPVAIGGVWWLGRPLAATLQARRADPRDAVAACLIGFGTPAIGAGLAILQQPLLRVPMSYYTAMEEGFGAVMEGSLALALLQVAVQPALCEELLFRGGAARPHARVDARPLGRPADRRDVRGAAPPYSAAAPHVRRRRRRGRARGPHPQPAARDADARHAQRHADPHRGPRPRDHVGAGARARPAHPRGRAAAPTTLNPGAP
jgi:hypothetical protein